MSAERLTNIYFEVHKGVVKDVTEKRGYPPEKYKRLELWKAKRLFQSLKLQGLTLLDQATKLLSGLIVCHALPNANHRTSFFFMDLFFVANDILFPHYRRRRDSQRKYRLDGERYIRDSKYILNLKKDQERYANRYRQGKRIMYLRGGGQRTIRAEDLGLSRKQYIKRHRGLTRNWLEEMLGDQSGRYLRTPENSLSNLIALAERRTSSHVRDS